ncbi:hypothetical protein GCM10027034_39370 [Ramlibacter solisilvae]|uniref:Uncharacterized protein n=1 Tax=Ramlibacter tataouinensis TaxID=94132 RepID=A0A127JU77_9BURK|nr:hypothetical protein [Ramlibacter tataouinensis]AMO23546.1 hypothetical protein UC35_12385 [Ramlibacter tataouinensis]
MDTSASAPVLADCEMFPETAIFNTRIDDTSRFPAHANSDSWVSIAGKSTPFGANWGNSSDPAKSDDYWGMPINVVDGTAATTQWPIVSFSGISDGQSSQGYAFKSDCAAAGAAGGYSIVRDCTSLPENARRFPFPSGQVFAEGGLCAGPSQCGDHHVLVVEKGACRLWESYYAHNNTGQWRAMATAAWNLRSNEMRPRDWASADAAGLPITPLLAKSSEAAAGEIRHALRVTFRDGALAQQPTWPARFATGLDDGGIPFGALMRLKAGFVIPDSWSPQAKAIATAAKRYGIYVADIGVDFYVQGEPSSAWDPALWQQLKSITMADMEFVDLRAVTGDPRFSPDSLQARW